MEKFPRSCLTIYKLQWRSCNRKDHHSWWEGLKGWLLNKVAIEQGHGSLHNSCEVACGGPGQSARQGQKEKLPWQTCPETSWIPYMLITHSACRNNNSGCGIFLIVFFTPDFLNFPWVRKPGFEDPLLHRTASHAHSIRHEAFLHQQLRVPDRKDLDF